MVSRRSRRRNPAPWLSDMPSTNEAASKAWMLTFTDLVSLMLTFFVLLFSMSNVKVDQWENVIDSLTNTLKPTPIEATPTISATFNIGTLFRKRAVNLDYLEGVLRDGLKPLTQLESARVILLEDRLVITFPGDLLFEPGRAQMTEQAAEALFILGGVFSNIDNEISVDGHTDPTPPVGDEYTSNWQLSTARAATVANSLRRAGYREKIVAYGYADSRYQQLPIMEEEKRRALGRRVDIVVLPTAGGN
jgi:chemotaxis protein MotB